MKLRRVMDGATFAVEIASGDGWVDAGRVLRGLSPSLPEADIARWSSDAVALLGAPCEDRSRIAEVAARLGPEVAGGRAVTLPIVPKSFRDFMLYEQHAIDAARGFVRMFVPRAWPIVRAYESALGAPFPMLKPHRLWYRQPVYYMGNHLSFAGCGADIAIPSYSRALDYELELGFVLKRGLFNASACEAEAAIGGFVVVNDFSARDVQRDEMRSGFGPQKSKHFRNAMSDVVISADEILPRWNSLAGTVRVNGTLVAATSTAGARWSLGETLAHASRSERLYPGELFATGTLPGGSGIENGRLLGAGDTIEIAIDGIGTLRNRIVARGRGACMKVIDLSKPVRFNRHDPFFMRVAVKHKPHKAAKLLVWILGLPWRLFPRDFAGWADDTISMGVHATTHIDAPWHYGPVSAGKPAQTIDEMPLERCIGPGVVLDFLHKEDDDPITVADMEAALAKNGATLTEDTIVLIMTGRDKLLGSKDYWKRGTGMSAAATDWLLDRGVTVMGIDQWGWDLPFRAQIAKSRATGDATLFWEAHRVGQRRPYWHMEQLTNLGALPPHGFEVAVFPLKIVGASAAPARAVALLR